MVRYNKGFTFVELITVILILSVLMVIVLPVMVSYIDQKDENSIKDDARLILISAQNSFNELYINGSNTNNMCIIEGRDSVSVKNKVDNVDPDCFFIKDGQSENFNLKRDCYINRHQIAKDILDNSGVDYNDNKPCILLIGTGNYEIYAADPLSDDYDPKKAYTIYQMMYEPEFVRNVNSDSDRNIIFWTSDKGFTYKMPCIDLDSNYKSAKNEINLNGETIYLQYYIIRCGKGKGEYCDSLWNYIRARYKRNPPY